MMSVNYTCAKCGLTSETAWPCDCPAKETKRNLDRRVKATIISSFQAVDGDKAYLYEHLRDHQQKSLYMRINLDGKSRWTVTEIDEADYDEFDDLQRLNELQQQGNVWTAKGCVDENGISYTIKQLDPSRLYTMEELPLADRLRQIDLDVFRESKTRAGWTCVKISGVEMWIKEGKVWYCEERTIDDATEKIFKRLQPGEWNYIHFVGQEMLDMIPRYVESGWTVVEFSSDVVHLTKQQADKEAVVKGEGAKKNKNAEKKRRQRQNRKARDYAAKRAHENEQTRGRMQYHCQAVRSPPVVCSKSDGEPQLCRAHGGE